MDKTVINISSDSKTILLIRTYLEAQALDDLCSFSEKEVKHVTVSFGERSKKYDFPVRLGLILDQILTFSLKKNTFQEKITLFGGILDVQSSVFVKNDGLSVVLTEKERDILLCLFQQKNHSISRKDLLRLVWNYADGVETHTLETHIYRLRQKIEEDASDPKTLMTDGDGYFLQNGNPN